MIHKRLVSAVPKSKKWVFASAFASWITLLSNVAMTYTIATFFAGIYYKSLLKQDYINLGIIFFISLIIRIIAIKAKSYFSYRSGIEVKQKLRTMLYDKFFSLKLNFSEHINMAEITQIGSEGIEQLDSYFGSYLPQFFFSMASPITLFIILAPFNFFAALVLFLCVPLIPLSIVVIQKIAKKILKKYFGLYAGLSDSFLDTLRGLITLKAYSDDDYQHLKLNEEAENFRKITMRVLTMQLNSIFVMDFIAYGGTALGIIVTLLQFQAGALELKGCLFFIFLCAEFFLPLRALGSFFHIAMNGITSANKLFEFIDIETQDFNEFSSEELKELEENNFAKKQINLKTKDLSFSYDGKKQAVKESNIDLNEAGFYGITGESGSGKSTIAALLAGLRKNYSGEILINDIDAKKLPDEFRAKYISLVTTESFLFHGTVRENLLIANPQASDEDLHKVLKTVSLEEFLLENTEHENSENTDLERSKKEALDFIIESQGKNLSGGQIQRFALARVLLKQSEIYIFDEAVSNVDVESEEIILQNLYELSKTKIVIFISHRLANITEAKRIFVFENGSIKESGTHQQLLEQNEIYAKLFLRQEKLEKIRQAS